MPVAGFVFLWFAGSEVLGLASAAPGGLGDLFVKRF